MLAPRQCCFPAVLRKVVSGQGRAAGLARRRLAGHYMDRPRLLTSNRAANSRHRTQLGKLASLHATNFRDNNNTIPAFVSIYGGLGAVAKLRPTAAWPSHLEPAYLYGWQHQGQKST